jgi:hypothetical protein
MHYRWANGEAMRFTKCHKIFYYFIMEFAILFLIALLIVILYNILNYIEMRFVQNDYKSAKTMIKDSIIIILASIGSLWIYANYESYFVDFFSIIMNKTGQQLSTLSGKVKDIPVFNDLPDF